MDSRFTTDISILIPVYGDAPYLKETLFSVFEQDFQGTSEIVIAYDRPTTSTLELVRSLPKKIELVECFAEKIGLVEALNVGLRNAKGKYIVRIDGDDLMYSSRLTKQFNFMEANVDIAVLGTSVTEIDSVGLIIGIREYPLGSTQIKLGLRKQCVIAHPSVIIRKSIFEIVEPYRYFFEYAEDYDLWLRVADKFKIENLKEPLTYYRVHSNQISQKQRNTRVFGSYSVRMAYALNRASKFDLVKKFKTFEKWENSLPGKILKSYVLIRLKLSDFIQKSGDSASKKKHASRFFYKGVLAVFYFVKKLGKR